MVKMTELSVYLKVLDYQLKRIKEPRNPD
ncbi:MAG: hypothetical protein SGVNAXEH_000387 [Holophagaceae bacterium]